MNDLIVGDTIYRQDAIDAIENTSFDDYGDYLRTRELIVLLPSAEPVIRCKDCKYYIPMNRETKTGICNLIMHQNFGADWFCAGAERRQDD